MISVISMQKTPGITIKQDMNTALWIEKYRPHDLSEIIGQERVISHLVSFAESGDVPHLVVSGPHGTGKSAAIECFSRRLYGENWEENVTIFSTSELFQQGKKYLEGDDRFSHIYKKDESFLTNFKYIVRSYASMRPLDAGFKLIVFEDASALTRDAQQALRRIMERYSRTCRFVFCTTNPSALIPAITSRCFPLFFTPLPNTVVLQCLRSVLAEECAGGDGIREEDISLHGSATEPLEAEDLELIMHMAGGDLRKALMLLQIVAESGGEIELGSLSQSETSAFAASAVAAVQACNFKGAKQIIETLMIDYGLTGREVVQEIRQIAKREYNHPRIALMLADTDAVLAHSTNEFIQLDALLAKMIREVFSVESQAPL